MDTSTVISVLSYIALGASIIGYVLKMSKVKDIGWVILQALLKGKDKLQKIMLEQRAAGLAARLKNVIDQDLIDGSLDLVDRLEAFIDDLLRPKQLS